MVTTNTENKNIKPITTYYEKKIDKTLFNT